MATVVADEKYCLICQRKLPFDQFGESDRSRDGHRSWCLQCEDMLAQYRDNLDGWSPNGPNSKLTVEPIKLPEDRDETIVFLAQLVQQERDKAQYMHGDLIAKTKELQGQVDLVYQQLDEAADTQKKAQDDLEIARMELSETQAKLIEKDSQLVELQKQLVEAQLEAQRAPKRDLTERDRKALEPLLGR